MVHSKALHRVLCLSTIFILIVVMMLPAFAVTGDGDELPTGETLPGWEGTGDAAETGSWTPIVKPPKAFAGGKSILRVYFLDSINTPMQSSFSIYKVASLVDSATSYSWVSAYQTAWTLGGISPDLNSNLNGETLNKMAEIMAESPATSPVATGTTTEGMVEFTNLDAGVYLVTPTDSSAKATGSDGNVYRAIPFLVAVPAYDSDKSDWNRTVSARAKYRLQETSFTFSKRIALTEDIEPTLITFEVKSNGTSSVFDVGDTAHIHMQFQNRNANKTRPYTVRLEAAMHGEVQVGKVSKFYVGEASRDVTSSTNIEDFTLEPGEFIDIDFTYVVQPEDKVSTINNRPKAYHVHVYVHDLGDIPDDEGYFGTSNDAGASVQVKSAGSARTYSLFAAAPRATTGFLEDGEFEFTLTVNGPKGVPVDGTYPVIGLNGEHGTITLVGGTAKFKINADQTITINKLPLGSTYDIQESPAEGYEPNPIVMEDGSLSVDTGIHVTAYNTPTRTAVLRIRKSIKPDVEIDPEIMPADGFPFKISLYKANEDGTRGAEYSKSETFTGHMWIKEHLESHNEEIVERNIPIYSGMTINIKDGHYLAIYGLPDETSYVVAETALDGWEEQDPVEQKVDLGGSGTSFIDVEFVNEPTRAIPRLPRSGGTGISVFIVVGLIFVGIAVSTYITANKETIK